MGWEDEEIISDLEEQLSDNRSRRFSVYLDPQLVELSRKYIGSNTNQFGSKSILYDTAIRRQVLHELQWHKTYASWLEDIPSLPRILVERISEPTIRDGESRESTPNGGTVNRQKEVVSGRTNPAIYLLMKMLIDDVDLPYESDSDFVEAGIRRLLSDTAYSGSV